MALETSPHGTTARDPSLTIYPWILLICRFARQTTRSERASDSAPQSTRYRDTQSRQPSSVASETAVYPLPCDERIFTSCVSSLIMVAKGLWPPGGAFLNGPKPVRVGALPLCVCARHPGAARLPHLSPVRAGTRVSPPGYEAQPRDGRHSLNHSSAVPRAECELAADGLWFSVEVGMPTHEPIAPAAVPAGGVDEREAIRGRGQSDGWPAR